MIDSFLGCNPLSRVHLKHPSHQLNFNVIHYCGITSFNRFRMGNLREFQSLITLISIEFCLQKLRQMAQNFLYDEKLINFRVAWEQWLTVHKLTHNAANGPNINLFTIR